MTGRDPGTLPPSGVMAVRLRRQDLALGRATFAVMAQVFGEDHEELGDAYLERLLGHEDFWAFAGTVDGEVVGGLTAHVLPMTRAPVNEIFIYDIAVLPDYQRRGVGSGLVAELRRAAAASGISGIFVPADDDDEHALDFYRHLGATPSPVTFFTFPVSVPPT